MITGTSKQDYRRAPIRRSQYLRLRKICHAWLAEQIERGGPEVEEIVLFCRSDIEDAAGVFAEEILLHARKQWISEGGPVTFGLWLRVHEAGLFTRAAETFLEDQRRLVSSTKILTVR